ncbi:MAG TPA: PqqD family protein [Vicinamibacterales bacterium]
MKIRRRADVIAQQVGDTAVLVNLSSNRIYELNASGARVWELLDTARSVEAIVGEIAQEFELSPDVVRADVAPLVDEFVREGLIEHDPQH